MTNQKRQNNGRKNRTTQNDERLSPDGLWRSYPKVPNLLCYVKSGTFYGRLKVDGKIIRRSLHREGETEISFTTAKLRLADFITKQRTKKAVAGTFAQALAQYEADMEADHSIGDNTKRYRRYCVKRLLKSWPELESVALEKITPSACKEWASKFSTQVDETYFNNTLGTFRAILKRGGMSDNPAKEVKRLGEKQTVLKLPEPEQFNALLAEIEKAGSRFSKHCADLVRFLAFSGCRISEARQVTWADVDFQRGVIKVHNAKGRRAKNHAEVRYIPIVPDMVALLEKLKTRNPEPHERVCMVSECEKSLTRACGKKEIARITHHDLRHLFATRCIESGVDIPTVSRWLGHSDGGALAMRVYGHLRASHSVEMAKRVSFGSPLQKAA